MGALQQVAESDNRDFDSERSMGGLEPKHLDVGTLIERDRVIFSDDNGGKPEGDPIDSHLVFARTTDHVGQFTNRIDDLCRDRIGRSPRKDSAAAIAISEEMLTTTEPRIEPETPTMPLQSCLEAVESFVANPTRSTSHRSIRLKTSFVHLMNGARNRFCASDRPEDGGVGGSRHD